MNSIFQYSAGSLQHEINAELKRWKTENKVHRLWTADASLWTNSDEAKWLGWLSVPEIELKEIPRIEMLANEIIEKGYKYLVVLGMGGSSLCPDMMTKIFEKIEKYPHLQTLDSTDPAQIQRLEDNIDLKSTIFIVSSKSGTTLEPNIYKDYFYSRVQTVLGKSEVGDRFIAITDPGTKLETIAKIENFREVFHGIPSIGGRYSALSNFGMVPSGLMGINLKDFLSHAQEMVKSCSPNIETKDNPGVLLGAILGVCATRGKDKVTLIISSKIQALGAWIEQLLAESTGKEGKGLIPIDQEPLGKPEVYGKDRVFVYIRLEDGADTKQDEIVKALEKENHIVVKLSLSSKNQLASELFRWEMATAVAGSILGINAFNQPDVEGSKKLAAQIITTYEKSKKIPKPNLLLSTGGISLYTDEKNSHEIEVHLHEKPSIGAYLKAHLSRVKQGDYVNLSAFIDMSEAHVDLLQKSRALIRDNLKTATCLGFGPRFLHSTGQDYKGGSNTGDFLQITADHPLDIAVPGKNFTFGLVIDAQAQADFEVLVQRSRRVLRIHLSNGAGEGLQEIYELLVKAFES